MHLDLSWNKIDQIQIGSFIGLPSLELLDLSHNSLQSLPTGAFIYSKQLKQLSLSHNNISDLAVSLLRGPQKLLELELDGNQLKSKQLNALFGDVEYLQRLEINGCGLNDDGLNSLNFGKILNLLKLGIGGNNLTQVPSASIRAMAQLQTLDLSNNQIRKLEPCAFCACNITRVFLRNNLLGLIPDPIDHEAFAGNF